MQTIIRATISLAIMCFGWAFPAQAQSLGLSFGTEGRLVSGYADQVPGSDIFLFGNATARLSFTDLPLGFEVGVFGLANGLHDTPHETYGTFTWDFGQGARLLVGVPRPAYDSFAVSAIDQMFPVLGVFNAGITHSRATTGAMFEGFLPYGARFEHMEGTLRFAASVEAVPNRDTTLASLGFAAPLGDLTLEAAMEVSWGVTTKVAGKVQLKGVIGQVKGGLGVYLPGTVGGPEVLEAFGSFDPAENFTLSGVVQIPLQGGDDPTLGLSARYAIAPEVGVSAGVLSEAGHEAAYTAFLDWTF